MTTNSASSPDEQRAPRRVHARVALGLLEALRDQDRPPEILDDENLTLTLPRRLGLSGVVDAQIRRYRDDARRGRRIPDSEAGGLIQLVIRRPDSAELFLRLGADLHPDPAPPRHRRFLPRRLQEVMAGRSVRRRLRTLFGRTLVQTATGPFTVIARDRFLLESDPGGDACAIITGLVRVELARFALPADGLAHAECLATGAEQCLWTLFPEGAADEPSGEG